MSKKGKKVVEKKESSTENPYLGGVGKPYVTPPVKGPYACCERTTIRWRGKRRCVRCGEVYEVKG